MSDKTRSNKKQLDPGQIAAQFWGAIEQRCSTSKGIKILESPYYGLRLEEPVLLSVGDKLVKTTITAIWRNFCQAAKINLDLALASSDAVRGNLLKSSVRRGKDPKTGEMRNYGVQYWTPNNTVYTGSLSKARTPKTHSWTRRRGS